LLDSWAKTGCMSMNALVERMKFQSLFCWIHVLRHCVLLVVGLVLPSFNPCFVGFMC